MIPAWLCCDHGADAAEDLLQDVFGVARKQQSADLEPLTGTGFERLLRFLLRDLLTVASKADQAALKRVLAVVDSDWPGMSPMEREARLREMARALGGVPRVLVPQLDRVFALQGPQIVAATKAAAADTYDLPIRGNFSLVDQRVVDAARTSQAHYIRNEYGRREERASEVARDIVAKGVERGLDRYAIAEELKPAMEAIGVNRSAGYFSMIASVFAARARTWGTISAFDEAGIESMEWTSLLDEATSAVCRFMDGKVFPVAAAREQHLAVAASPDPESVVQMQPWVHAGKAQDGSVALFYKQGGERKPIAMVERSGVGTKDDRGEFSGAASVDKLIAAGITSPPLHAHCRSLLVPASGSVAVVQVPYQMPVTTEAKPERRPREAARPAWAPPSLVVPRLRVTRKTDEYGPYDEVRDADGDLQAVSASQRTALDAVERLADAARRIDLSELVSGATVDERPAYLATLAKALKKPKDIHAAMSERALKVADLARLRFPSSKLDADLAKSFAAHYFSTSNKQPVLVCYRGDFYVHDGAELLLAQKVLGASPSGLAPVSVIDLDLIDPPKMEDRAAWSREVSSAISNALGGVDDGSSVRAKIRELLGAHGIPARDPGRRYEIRFGDEARETSALHLVTSEADIGGARAVHTWLGVVKAQRGDVAEASKTARLLGDRAAYDRLSPDDKNKALDAISTLVHEESHGASRIAPSAYQGVGVGIEEALTEVLARKITRDLAQDAEALALPKKTRAGFGHETSAAARPFYGAYQGYIRKLLDEVSGAYGDDQDAGARVEQAAVKTRRWRPGERPIHDPAAQIDEFVDALPDLPTQKRKALKAKLKDPAGPLMKQ